MNNNDSVSNNAGGIKGFFTGKQSLASAFWLIGVLPALMVAGFLFLINISGDLSFAELMLLTFSITIPLRLIAWFSIFRCIGNTGNAIWSFLAGFIVVIDILHKLIFWPIVWVGYQDNIERKARTGTDVESCKTELHKLSGQPLEKVSVQHFKNYDDGEPYYLAYYIDNGIHYYKCRVYPDRVSLEERTE